MSEEERKEDQQKKKPSNLTVKNIFIIVLVIISIPIIILYLPLYGIWYLIYSFWLSLRVRIQWYPKGKKMLFVYSNSPNWKEYLENNILPNISENAVIINWSERSKWHWKNKPLELKIFKHWTGVFRYIHISSRKKKWYGEEFNPIAITFVPWWRVEVFRFWRAFRDFKHGKDKKLRELENQMFEILK